MSKVIIEITESGWKTTVNIEGEIYFLEMMKNANGAKEVGRSANWHILADHDYYFHNDTPSDISDTLEEIENDK